MDPYANKANVSMILLNHIMRARDRDEAAMEELRTAEGTDPVRNQRNSDSSTGALESQVPPDLLDHIRRAQKEDEAQLEELRAARAASFPNRNKNTTNDSIDVPHSIFNASSRLIEGCHFCCSNVNVSRCGGCKVVYYCNREHQTVDRASHKTVCNKIKQGLVLLEAQETSLRVHPGDEDTPPNAFELGTEGYGNFWMYRGTRPYMQARFTLVQSLLQINTVHAVEGALEHCLAMLHLNHSDSQGMRSYVPPLYLRLGRDQDCYDFLKWWAVNLTWGTDGYVWGDPKGMIKDVPPFEPVNGFLKSANPMSHTVSLVLLKVRMLIDMLVLAAKEQGHNTSTHPQFASSIMEDIVACPDQCHVLSGSDWAGDSEMQLHVVKALCMAVHSWNKTFWSSLLSPGDLLTMRLDGDMDASTRHVAQTLQQCYTSWTETSGALDVIREILNDNDIQQVMRDIEEDKPLDFDPSTIIF